MTDASRIGALVVGLAVLVFAGVVSPVFFLPAGTYGDLSTALTWQVVDVLLAAGVAYAGLVAVVRRRGVPGVALWVAVGIGLAARLVIVTAPPVLSTDLYRYVWDGRVQAAGISPYRYVPADPALERLRDASAGPTAIYPNINRAETAPTIYPPAAQMLFAAIGVTASSIWTMKGVMLALDVLAGVFAWRLLREAGRPEAWVLVWALNPLVIREFAGAGHVDAASLAASGAALLLAARRRPGWAGAALGVAIMCKLLPAALVPAIWRPRGWRAPVACLAVIVADTRSMRRSGGGCSVIWRGMRTRRSCRRAAASCCCGWQRRGARCRTGRRRPIKWRRCCCWADWRLRSSRGGPSHGPMF